jgi:hypothetical protein
VQQPLFYFSARAPRRFQLSRALHLSRNNNKPDLGAAEKRGARDRATLPLSGEKMLRMRHLSGSQFNLETSVNFPIYEISKLASVLI